MNDYMRFLAKLYFGILCGYLGNEFSNHKIGKKLIDIIKTKGDSLINKYPNDIKILKHNDRIASLQEITYIPNSISISLVNIDNFIFGILTIDKFIVFYKIGNINRFSRDELVKLNFSLDNKVIHSGTTLLLKEDSESYEEIPYQEYIINGFCTKFKVTEITRDDMLKLFKNS